MPAWNNRSTTSVLASGIVASVVAPGVVYCSEQFLPDQMTAIKKQLATHVILPQLKLFEKLSTGLDKAHAKYNEKKREEQLRRGEKIEDVESYTPQERAYFIADALVKGSVALTSDFVTTYAFLRLSNRIMGADHKAGRTTFVDAGVTLGCIAVMPTLFAEISENVHHGMRRIIQKITGMNKESADRIALSSTYVGIPGIIGTAAGIVVAARR